MISHGHYLFQLLQQGKYFAATRGVVAYDYWDELPADRKAQYEHAAEMLMAKGRESQAARMFDSEAATMPPPPRDSRP